MIKAQRILQETDDEMKNKSAEFELHEASSNNLIIRWTTRQESKNARNMET